MSSTLKLVRLNDFTADIDSVDLLSGGYKLAPDGYIPTVAPLGAKSVHESITINISGTSNDHLATLVQALDAKVRQVGDWINEPSVERYQVWLRAMLQNESGTRQSQVLNIEPPDKIQIYNKPQQDASFIAQYSIGIERTAWEMPNPYTSQTFTGLDVLGGTASFSGTIGGDMAARLPQVIIGNTTAGGFAGAWIGFKTSRFGNPDNFIPTWPLTLSDDMGSTSDMVDSSAYSGTAVQCTFGTATILDRAIISLGTVTATNAADYRGSYTVLLRAKMSDTSVARAQIGFGFAPPPRATASLIYRSRQVISGTDWKLYEMGSISIPSSFISPNEIFPNFSISVRAERISGAGYLQMDVLILIPTEGMIRTLDPNPPAVDVASQTRIYQTANDTIYSFALDGSGPYSIDRIFNVSPVNWSLPNKQSKLVIVYADGMPGNIKGSTVDVTCTYTPRWRTLRGNDS